MTRRWSWLSASRVAPASSNSSPDNHNAPNQHSEVPLVQINTHETSTIKSTLTGPAQQDFLQTEAFINAAFVTA